MQIDRVSLDIERRSLVASALRLSYFTITWNGEEPGSALANDHRFRLADRDAIRLEAEGSIPAAADATCWAISSTLRRIRRLLSSLSFRATAP